MCWTVRFRSLTRAEKGTFLLATACRPALGSTQPPVQWVPGALSLGAKRLWCEEDLSSAEVRMRGVTPPFPQYAFMVW
jgi:hypothetical protein